MSGRLKWLLIALALSLLFAEFVSAEPNPFGDPCTDAIWFQKPCDGQPIQLGTRGAGDDCSAHTLTIGDEITEDHRLYAIISQCPTDLDLPCRTYPKPDDSAGAAAIAKWERCFKPPDGCPPNEKVIHGDDGVDYETSRKPPDSAGPTKVAHWNQCYLPRFQVDRACPGRSLPGGRQVIRLWTLSAVPFPPPNAEAQRAAKARSYGCDLGLPTSTPAPARTSTRVVTAARTPTRRQTVRPGCCPPRTICPQGVPPCVSTTRSTTPSRTASRSSTPTVSSSPARTATSTAVATQAPSPPPATATRTTIATPVPVATRTVLPPPATPASSPTKPPGGSGCSPAILAMIVLGVIGGTWSYRARA